VEKHGTARQATDDNIIRRMRFACWITKATDTHTEYVIFIAFPRQKWLRERASTLRYTYISCLVLNIPFYPPVITPFILHVIFTVHLCIIEYRVYTKEWYGFNGE
jgi:hypothetical protein